MATQASSFEAEVDEQYALPPIPNQEIYFYRKPIDNSGVVRKADPKAQARCWSWIAAATAATFLVAGMLGPSAYGMLEGSQVEKLKKARETLQAELKSLEAQEASLLSPENLELIAQESELLDPAPNQLVDLSPAPDGSLARNLNSK